MLNKPTPKRGPTGAILGRLGSVRKPSPSGRGQGEGRHRNAKTLTPTLSQRERELFSDKS
jgi:hypothetical protein